MEEFEEKIDKIAEGEDDGENSWISKIYNQFSFFNDGENFLGESDMDGLEPPLLDETWGLGVRTGGKGENSSEICKNFYRNSFCKPSFTAKFDVAVIKANQATCSQSFHLLGNR